MGQYAVLDDRDIVGTFYNRFEQSIEGSWAPIVTWTNPDSTSESETYKWLGAPAGPRAWVGGRHEGILNRYAHTITNVKYEDTMAIDVDDLRRDKTGQIRVRISEMAAKAAAFPQTLVSTLISNGTTGLAYDGEAFFDTDHAESGTDQVNLLTSTQVPSADVATATKPTPSEMANIIIETIGYMLGYTDDQGDPINGEARSWMIMAGTAPIFSAVRQAIGLNALASGADNPLKGWPEMNVGAVYNPRLSDHTTHLYVFRTDGIVKPFIEQVELPWETQLIGVGSETEFNTDQHKFGLKGIYGYGYGMWQHAAKVTMS